MKEYIERIPDDSEEIITAIMEKFGTQVTEIKQEKTSTKKPSTKKKRTTPKEKLITPIGLVNGRILTLMQES
ncbi:MAG TPA: hypothetical protein VFU62_14330 [Hanamia sp.]|jgi:hypothetical protein|nr:hypothetical protein [Hanamia sp.]